ncbi:substrate-binding domain-containing protein [Chloroflexota bacterium]
MIDIYLNGTSATPLYRQIVGQVKQLVAINALQPGEHLPTVRQLARHLQINPGTVSRAYSELERQGVVMSRRGGGTIVTADTQDPRLIALRQRQLSNMLSNSILDALSLGYSPQELEEVFSIHLASWRRDRQGSNMPTSPNTISIAGSDDLALNLLIGRLKQKHPEITTRLSCAGSLGGLIALQQGEADLAGIHLLDEETGEYNYPYIKHILPGIKVAVIHLAYRAQGFILPPGNPKKIKKLEDLRRPGVVLINRQTGSGTRVLLDLKLRELGIATNEINGYGNQQNTHLAVASIIAEGKADVGLGIEAAALSCDLDFIPLFKERYDLIIPAQKYNHKPVSHLVNMVKSEDFKKAFKYIEGYDTSETGMLTFKGS